MAGAVRGRGARPELAGLQMPPSGEVTREERNSQACISIGGPTSRWTCVRVISPSPKCICRALESEPRWAKTSGSESWSSRLPFLRHLQQCYKATVATGCPPRHPLTPTPCVRLCSERQLLRETAVVRPTGAGTAAPR